MYLAGFLSDVADGLLARKFGVQSEAGTANDGRADVAFHALVGAGLAIAAVREQQWWVLGLLAALLAGGPLARRLVAVHTVVGKAIGGAYRVLIFFTFVALAEPAQRAPLVIGGLVVLCTTYVYEAKVTLAEFRGGERTMR
jgi:phosphatidylglycerophosphate synthase